MIFSLVILSIKTIINSIQQKFQIPKEYRLDFLVSRYFIGIAVKSEKHKKFNEQLKKLRGELPENRIV